MTIAATAWAFSAESPQTPLERLLLVLLADDTDDFGVCVTRLDDVALAARMDRGEVIDVLERMARRGEISLLAPVDGQFDPDIAGFDLLLFDVWKDRRALETIPAFDGLSLRHPVYGWMVVA